MASPQPDEKEVLMEMTKEALGIRASLDQFVQGFKPFEEAQAGQAVVVSKLQTGLERLAELGTTAHMLLPASINEVMERGDRPSAGAEVSVGEKYEASGTGLDSMDKSLVEAFDRAEERERIAANKRRRIQSTLDAFSAKLSEAFPTTPPPVPRSLAYPLLHQQIFDDATLGQDLRTVMTAAEGGKVHKLLRLHQSAKRGQPAASMILESKTSVNVNAPADGSVSQHHVREGDVVQAGTPLMTISTNALVQLLSSLKRISNIACNVERAVPSDEWSSSAIPTRFTLVVAVSGVLTARMAVRRYGASERLEAETPAPLSARGKAPSAVSTPHPDGQKEGGDDIMMTDGGDGDGDDAHKTDGSGAKGLEGGMVRIESISVGGVTELLSPWEASNMAVFRAINHEANAMLHLLRHRSSRREEQTLMLLVQWLSHYRSLFTTKCTYCRKILVVDTSSNVFRPSYLPPSARTLSGTAYHPQCRPSAAPEFFLDL